MAAGQSGIGCCAGLFPARASLLCTGTSRGGEVATGRPVDFVPGSGMGWNPPAWFSSPAVMNPHPTVGRERPPAPQDTCRSSSPSSTQTFWDFSSSENLPVFHPKTQDFCRGLRGNVWQWVGRLVSGPGPPCRHSEGSHRCPCAAAALLRGPVPPFTHVLLFSLITTKPPGPDPCPYQQIPAWPGTPESVPSLPPFLPG